MRWEGDGGDPALGAALMKVADSAATDEFELRMLVAKLDPQALD
jgi:hypothetical protein